ncbi:MBL fold metallo-hydrolase [Fuscibacter oryzae]|uniref:MBL fold metallo-hydrolase n=1 Tax=Fuscibacter oryzae TaxID=2803939 RepID=A0A8J7MNX6_9RHOB|nr:MBL fold metallo-hydrolase [Fuscibacter oryzae]MBL4927717.1 MBL fold metallo-hydrolase [Fuscibacter oryzae]
MRILEPAPGILGFYEGRDGVRYLPQENWVDDGALSLGIASYALLAGDHALVYDTHVAPDRARFIRKYLKDRGIRHFTVVLSHWHLDHVAGTEAFADCEVIANTRTAAHLLTHKSAIEDGSFHGAPAINPLILPTRIFDHLLALEGFGERVELLTFNIHSDDATIIWLPDRGILLAGDTVEDCVTYVGEVEYLESHVADLARLATLNPAKVLPNHGSPDIIATGGYPPGLITATADYTRALIDRRAARPLPDLLKPHLDAGHLHYFQPYEAIHAQNLARVAAIG